MWFPLDNVDGEEGGRRERDLEESIWRRSGTPLERVCAGFGKRMWATV